METHLSVPCFSVATNKTLRGLLVGTPSDFIENKTKQGIETAYSKLNVWLV